MNDARGDIENTLHRWCWAMDDRDLTGVAECWHPDAVQHVQLPGRPPARIEGRAAILARLEGSWRKLPPAGVRHVPAALWIEELTPDSARVRSYSVSLRLTDGRPGFSSLGRHHDTLVRVDGRWLIREREQYVDGWMAAQ